MSFTIGAVLTLGANVASVHPIAVPAIAYALAGTPAVALLLSADMLLRLCLPARAKGRKPAKKATQTAVKAPSRTTRARATAPDLAPSMAR